MKASILEGLDAGHRPLLERALKEADRRHLALYLVGGPVRDWLLGRPLRDLDLLVEATGSEVAALTRRIAVDGAKVELHERFGTAHVATPEGGLDLAALRRERYARPGALPTIEPGTLEEDLRRRDFTVNAMAYPLNRQARERLDRGAMVVDPGKGMEDLRRGLLRVFHARSFHDDPTRALRAARLAARLGFRLARSTRNALREALEEGALSAVSGDRVRRELDLLFKDSRLGSDPIRALQALERWGVLDALHPGLSVPRPVFLALRRLGRAVLAPPWSLDGVRILFTALALWCEGLGPASRRALLARLSLRGHGADLIVAFAQRGNRVLARCERARGRGALDLELAPLAPEIWLALYTKAGSPLRRRIVRWVLEDRRRRPPLSGQDLRDLDLSGPLVGQALQAVRVAWLDGKFATREEALSFAREWARQASRRAKRSRTPKRKKSK